MGRKTFPPEQSIFKLREVDRSSCGPSRKHCRGLSEYHNQKVYLLIDKLFPRYTKMMKFQNMQVCFSLRSSQSIIEFT